MAQTSINIRMDEDLKRRFEEFCDDVGLTMTAAFTLYAKAVLRENRIPFEVSAVPSSRFSPFDGESNRDRILKSIKELKEGRGKSHDLIDVEED